MKPTLKRILTTLMIFGVFGFSSIWAQTFEEYKKQQQDQYQKFKEDREKQIKALADEFDEYVKKQDEEYTEYLKERWKQFQGFQGLEIPEEEPKPDIQPVFEKPERQKPPEGLPARVPEIEVEPLKIPEQLVPRVTKQEPDRFPVNSTEFAFYGFPILFDYDKALGLKLEGTINEEEIGNYFAALSKTNYNHLIGQLLNYKDQMNLNDWGYYQLAQKAAYRISEMHENTSRLLHWFILLRSGYRAKVAFYEDQVFLLIPAESQLYGVNFFTLDNLNYYMLEGNLTNVFTYEMDFPEARKVFDMNIYHPILLGENLTTKTINYSYQGEEIPVTIGYNTNIINFYNDCPLSDIKVYFDAVVSPEAKESLASNFMPLIQSKSQIDAANILLNFVQTAFEYQTDQEQFGYEKFFFAEELFFYPYADCEDRSVLFAYLVKSLMGLEVVGLNYPGHMATAVNFTDPVEGDYIVFNDKKFIISDPTYINAPIGLTMPQYVDDEAIIVVLNNDYAISQQKHLIWNEIIAAGGNRGDNKNDILLDNDGNALITGYFTDRFNFRDQEIIGSGNPAMFTMMLDAGKNTRWFSTSSGDGFAMAYGLSKDEDGNTYVTGTFNGEMIVGDTKLKSDEKSDIFVAKYESDGKLIWIEKAGLDTVNQENYLNFVARFDPEGKNLGHELYFETGDFNKYGVNITDEGEIYVAGAFNKTTGMNISKMSFDALGDFDPINSLKEENDMLITKNYEQTIAGLFAVVNLIRGSGVSIPGSDAQKVLDKNNPEFRKEAPGVYESIGRIHFIKNDDGIVSVKTTDEKNVHFDMMRIRNESKVKISQMDNGDAKIEVLSGVRVGMAFIWYDLNYIVMYKSNGDMLFDYASDHTQKIMNLKEDILY